MIIDNFNLNHLRIFECVYRNQSMTKAAAELHMTQSGVSQHIKLLEDVLEVKLFDRIKQRLIPTGKAKQLFDECSKNLYELEKTLTSIKGGDQILSGMVNIGLPIEFGNNLVLPILGDLANQHPRIKFSISYGLAPQMNDLLLKGKLDFAFVDTFGLDKQIKSTVAYQETLVLCASKNYLQNIGKVKEDKKYFEQLEYVDYSEDKTILQMWFKHHYRFKGLSLNLRATLLDVQGVAQMIKFGKVAGVLPLHLIKKLDLIESNIHIFKGSGKPLLNEISLAYLSEKTQTPTVAKVIQYVSEALAEKQS